MCHSRKARKFEGEASLLINKIQFQVNQSTLISVLISTATLKYDGTNNTRKCRPADDEVQQKQAPTEAVPSVSLAAICSWRYRENDCDVIYEVIQFSVLWSSRLSRLSPNNKDPESEPEDNSSSMSSSNSEAELECASDTVLTFDLNRDGQFCDWPAVIDAVQRKRVKYEAKCANISQLMMKRVTKTIVLMDAVARINDP
ncbi:hypothetical protein Tco_0420707 [Tanacetum coccineum]